jgi:stearoyl-CoA desaturase (delta-9 desaturase)
MIGLAKVLRVAPQLDVRPNINVPDAETIRAMMAHRWQVATDYFATVIKPQLTAKTDRMPWRLRNGLRSDGRWLPAAHRERMQAWIAERPQLGTLMEYRQRLLAIYEIKSAQAETKLEALRAWCAEAEASGNAALQEFSARLKGYALVPARA